jgi:AhpD family alkylhydroperoxidase
MTESLDTGTEELIAIGAALAANCEPCLRYHVRRGAEAGCTPEAMRRAAEIGHAVKATPARLLARLADRLLGSSLAPRGEDSPCATAGLPTAGRPPEPCCSAPMPLGGEPSP